MRPRRCATRWTWRGTRSSGATRDSGWPSITTCPASPARPRRWGLRTSRRARRRSAAALGLPFALASHFAAAQMIPAVDIYRARFKPSAQLEQPYVILGANIVAADNEEEARLLASSGRQSIASLRAGMPTALPPPSREWAKEIVPFDAARLEELQSVSLVGSGNAVAAGLRALAVRTQTYGAFVLSHT